MSAVRPVGRQRYRWRPGRPPAGSQQAGLAEQVDRRRPVAELGDRDRVGLQLAERRLRGRDGHAGPDRVLIALLVAARPADDLLALLADQEGEELLRRRLVLAVLEHPRAGDVDDVAGVVRGEVGDLRVRRAGAYLGLEPVPVVLVMTPKATWPRFTSLTS